MEVGQQGVDDAELEARRDEQVGRSSPGTYSGVPTKVGRLDSACRRGANHDDSSSGGGGVTDGTRRVFADLLGLRVDSVLLDALGPHRLERAVPDVQGEGGALHASRLELEQQLWCEMQAGGRRGHRSTAARKDGLIALTIESGVLALDVRG